MGLFDSIGKAIGSITNPINQNLSNLGNNINRGLSDFSNQVNDSPIARGLVMGALGGGGLGLATTLGTAMEHQQRALDNLQKPATDFGGLTSKWDQLQQDIGGRFLQQNVEDIGAQSAQGMGAGMQALGQKGGLGIGAQNRMQQQSKWDIAQQSALANQAAQQMGTQFGMNKIMGVDIPVLQGKEMSAAQAEAARRQGRSSTGQMLGSLAGMALGGAVGGPMGMQLGGQFGGALGTALY